MKIDATLIPAFAVFVSRISIFKGESHVHISIILQVNFRDLGCLSDDHKCAPQNLREHKVVFSLCL